MEDVLAGKVIAVNGPIVRAQGLGGIKMFDIAEVGADRLIGEVIRLAGEIAIIQVYEDNTGLKPGDEVISYGRPLSVLLGPGLIANIYDGIQRPLVGISEACGSYIRKGIKLSPLDTQKKWDFRPLVKAGGVAGEGTLLGEVRESPLVMHRVLVPPGVSGKLTKLAPAGAYTIEEEIFTVEAETGTYAGRLAAYWPVRRPRPNRNRKKPVVPLITGQRIIDTFFPIARGGTAAIPGGFGTGKTMTQHALAKWCNADIIVYIGCGERGNEMTDVLTDFPKLIDERNGRPLIERTVMIANTSNMPVPAREVSIYTGVTIAEYYRDMGYSVAVMADSTSRWAEALRELASRLGDMPAEEGFPPYLATRLAEFYERAGLVETLSGSDGDITIIGAVSPPGGDFSEPVTQHTSRFVRCFWALDKTLADARHYPSISWIESYTEYLADIEDWWKTLDARWFDIRNEAMNILLEDHRLEQVVKLVGSDALPPAQQYILLCAETIKNAFLQQNSFDPEDKFCSPEKQIRILSGLLLLYRRGLDLVQKGVGVKQIAALDAVSGLVRLKSEIPNRDLSGIDAHLQRLEEALAALAAAPTGG
ncbi:MAG: V-type ATP synthase subunit A [Smithellaceae bacterium]|nr:V-type ATP synthase subunit A [Smithellaceae bacterium]NLX50999.1 V-type ATP synthase subunit A [Deltaproteobacteria bacterium]